jgi:hypothetical protein
MCNQTSSVAGYYVGRGGLEIWLAGMGEAC